MSHRDHSGAILISARASTPPGNTKPPWTVTIVMPAIPSPAAGRGLGRQSAEFVMAHALKAYMTLIGGNEETILIGVAAYEAAKDLPANERERAHLGAIDCLLQGRIRAAGRILEDLTDRSTRATPWRCRRARLMDFLTGDGHACCSDRIGRAPAPSWYRNACRISRRPGHAGLRPRRRQALRPRRRRAAARPIELAAAQRLGPPRRGRPRAGDAGPPRRRRGPGSREDMAAWTDRGFFQVHNWWHLALFHLGLGESTRCCASMTARSEGRGRTMALRHGRRAPPALAACSLRGHRRSATAGGRLADVYRGQADKRGPTPSTTPTR